MKIKKSYLVEVVLSQKTNNPFPVDTFLDGKTIVGIEAFSATQISTSPNGNTVANGDMLKMGFLSLDVDGSQPIQNLPLPTLVTSNNNGVMKEFENLKLRLNKSYISFPTPSRLTAGEVILLNFYYEN